MQRLTPRSPPRPGGAKFLRARSSPRPRRRAGGRGAAAVLGRRCGSGRRERDGGRRGWGGGCSAAASLVIQVPGWRPSDRASRRLPARTRSPARGRCRHPPPAAEGAAAAPAAAPAAGGGRRPQRRGRGHWASSDGAAALSARPRRCCPSVLPVGLPRDGGTEPVGRPRRGAPARAAAQPAVPRRGKGEGLCGSFPASGRSGGGWIAPGIGASGGSFPLPRSCSAALPGPFALVPWRAGSSSAAAQRCLQFSTVLTSFTRRLDNSWGV